MIEVPKIEPPEGPVFHQRVIPFAEFTGGQMHAISSQELELAAKKAMMANELARAYSSGLAKEGVASDALEELLATAQEEATFTGIYRARVAIAGNIETRFAMEFEPVAIAGLAATLGYSRFALAYRSKRRQVTTLEKPEVKFNRKGLGIVERPRTPKNLEALDPETEVRGYFVTPEYSELSRLSPSSRERARLLVDAARIGISEF